MSKEALAEQQEQQGCLRCNTPKKCALHGCSPLTWPAEQPAQQEPVACANGCRGFVKYPAQRKPLTDEEILNFGPGQPDAVWSYEDQLYFARAIEAAHGIKENT